MLTRPTRHAVLLLITTSILGCGQQPSSTMLTTSDNEVAIDKNKYLLKTEPEDVVGVITLREEAKDQDPVVLVGRIGGRRNPWIKGRCAFTVIDASMSVVADGQESGQDQVCLDDCCASLRTTCTLLVKIVDENGNPLAIDTRKLFDVKENDMVVVKGTVHRDEAEGTCVVAAQGIYLRQ